MNRALFIDIKEGEVYTYLLEERGDTYELKETRKLPSPSPDNLSFEGASEITETSYMSLPLSSLNFRIVDLPFSDREKIREILPMELQGTILGGSDNVVFDAIVVSTSDGRSQVLAAYIEKSVLKEMLEKFKNYGLDPVYVTCLELRHALRDFSLTKLFSPASLEEKDRMSLAVQEVKTPTINLRRDEFEYTRDIAKTRKSLKVTAVLAILFMLVVTADVLFKIISTRYEIAVTKNDIRKRYQELFPGEKSIVNELHQLKSHFKELKGKEDIYIGVSPLDLLLNLSRVDRQGIVFNEITLDSENIILKGEAPSLGDVQQIQDRLNPVFADVTISDSKASAQGRMLFTMTAKGKKS